MKKTFSIFFLFLVFALGISFNAFSENRLSGMVKVDGSSTVFPITEAMAEEFQREHRRVRVTVGLSGTGGGMKKFVVGDIDISGASRPIKKSEREKAKKNGVSFVELPVAYDGIAVVINPKNTFASQMTVEELKRIWEPGSQVKKWSDLRKAWPKKNIHLYGPGADSGTFEYFTKAIVGKARATRRDFTASEDDNVLVQGVAGDEYALGYFGFAYWVENQKALKRVAIDPGTGPILPSKESIEDGSYRPLSRPIFIYVNHQSIQRPEVDAFVRFYLNNARALVPEVGYVPFESQIYLASLNRFQKRILGTVFGSDLAKKKTSMKDLLSLKGK